MAAKAPLFRLVAEPALNSELKAGKLRRVYYLYGEEVYLTGLYCDKIVKTAGGEEADGLNFLRLRGVPDMNALSDFAESMPFFAEYKCVRITDLDAEDMDNDQLKSLISLIEQLPDTTVLIIAQTGLEIDDKKPKAKKGSGKMTPEVAAAIGMALDRELGGEVYAAIALAMHRYMNDTVHDRESYIITIRHNQSAWNNKEQGFRKYPR